MGLCIRGGGGEAGEETRSGLEPDCERSWLLPWWMRNILESFGASSRFNRFSRKRIVAVCNRNGEKLEKSKLIKKLWQ